MPPQSDKKIKQNHSCCGHLSACNSCSCPSHTCPFSLVSAATSSFLSSSSEHEVSRFLFFWSKFHLGQNGERKLRAALPVLDTHPVPSACHQSVQGRVPAAGTALSGMGHGANAVFDPRGSSGSSHQPQPTLAPPPAASRAFGRAHWGRFAFQNYPSSGAAPYLPFPSAPGDTIPFLHQLGVFGSKGNLIPPQQLLVAQSVTLDPSLPSPAPAESVLGAESSRRAGPRPTSHAAVLQQGLLAI